MDNWRKKMVNWLEGHRSLVVLFFCLPASFIFDKLLVIYSWLYREIFCSALRHDQKVANIQNRVRKWESQTPEKRKLLCTSRPNWLSLSTTFFRKVILKSGSKFESHSSLYLSGSLRANSNCSLRHFAF